LQDQQTVLHFTSIPEVLDGLRIVPIQVNHPAPTIGFLISDERTTILYSADTYQTDNLWRAASSMPNLHAAFIEVSYPNAHAALAQTAKHLTPEFTGEEFRKLGRPDLPVDVYHVKPRFRSAVETALRQLPITQITVLEDNLDLTFWDGEHPVLPQFRDAWRGPGFSPSPND
jgi:ribonuclease BN (tRNA processing enzyme)